MTLANTTALSYSVSGLSGGQTYAFQVRSYNKYGYGAFTASASVSTSQAPAQPVAPTVTVVGSYVDIAWTEPFPNYSPIAGFGYQILIAAADGTFIEDKALCDGVAQAAVGHCLVAMWDLRGPPFLLTYGTLVQAKVLAANARGWSAPSAANTVGATIQVEPFACAAPTSGANTGPTQLDVHWSSLDLYNAGGSPVLSYDLQYDNATAATTWFDVVGLSPASLLTSVIVSTGVVPGHQYAFRVRARNVFGWGPFSAVTYIQAARAPAAPVAPVTAIDAATGGLVITWQAPNDAGATITAYVIQIADATTTTWSTVASCDGSAPLIVAARTCTVPMSTLTAAPFNYVFGSVVLVKVQALNSYGAGDWSPISSNSGSTIASVPTQMAAPTMDLTVSTDTYITLRWTPLSGAAAGNSAVVAYSLYWDQGDATRATADTPLMDSLDTHYVVTGVTGGAPYRFVVSARNIYGPGAFSPVLTAVPTDAPGKTGIATVVLTDAT